jgi:hypothetical protein
VTSPFRTPGQRPSIDEDDEEEEDDDFDRSLGPLRSRHGRKGVLAFVLDGGYPIIDLHQRGLVRRGANDTATEVYFDEIDQLFFHGDQLLGTRVRIKTLKGRELEIPGALQGVEAIHAALNRFVTIPFTKSAKEALARGEHLTFGPVIFQVDALVINGSSHNYSDLSYVAAEDVVFVFYSNTIGRVGWVKISEVPHPKVFLEVLRMRMDVVVRGFAL